MVRIGHLNLYSYLVTSVIDYFQRKICHTTEGIFGLYYHDTVST